MIRHDRPEAKWCWIKLEPMNPAPPVTRIVSLSWEILSKETYRKDNKTSHPFAGANREKVGKRASSALGFRKSSGEGELTVKQRDDAPLRHNSEHPS